MEQSKNESLVRIAEEVRRLAGEDVTANNNPLAVSKNKSLADIALNLKEVEIGVAANMAKSTASSVSDVVTDLNTLITNLKDAGIVAGDDWNVSVLACPTPGAMPTTETKNNSGHATVTIDDEDITITLNCAVSELEDANHGTTWGTHKWLGFGVRTGLSSVVGVKFTDDTGASATLAAGDATEATALGLSAGDFVLYIKAEDPAYLTGKKYFTLAGLGMAKTDFTMTIVEG